MLQGVTLFSEFDIYLFKQGVHYKLYEKLGAHLHVSDGRSGVYFATWAPNATSVSVIADFNHFDISAHPLQKRADDSGIWEGFVCDVNAGAVYKYFIDSPNPHTSKQKADPYAFFAEVAPNSGSRVWDVQNYAWNDASWMKNRKKNNSHKSPISIYEVHLGSWRRKVEENNRFLNYIEIAYELSSYAKEMGFTHVELLPITEYPFEGSWGYQTTGYFAPTARYGTAEQMQEFIDILHQNGIGVILDWVPSHFVTDGHGLSNFDGSCLYEHKDPKRGYHPQWKSAIFNYDRNEVRAFLINSALFWLEMYHFDGIRVDAVASMLYLDYAREEGEWIPNEDGSNVNRGAVQFLKELNSAAYGVHKDIIMFAEESTNYSMVTRLVSDGGLGFGYKWNMGWMHDILKYMKQEPIARQHHHDDLTFSFVYMYNENYILPLSHDEVVHMKGSLIGKMPGDYAKKFANLRAMFALMFAHPGKKLLFMGAEFAQFAEWAYDRSLDWHLLDYESHKGVQKCIQTLNHMYANEPCLHKNDVLSSGFEWIHENDCNANVISFIRKGTTKDKPLIVVCNFADKEHIGYELGLPTKGEYKEIFNSQSTQFGGYVAISQDPIKTQNQPCHGRKNMLKCNLPALSVVYLKKI
ncbi:MAG: 1,4-alpha-glucan branching protein GlgB [Sulfurospirillum sp.]|nr:1,4-alpha-glucan branching protein GlgB [Sulfurospirillum sp.]